MVSYSFSVWFTAGSPYRECLHREIDGTVWTPAIKNTVIVMLYPPYTPLSLITTSLQAIEDQANVGPRPSVFGSFFFPLSIDRLTLLIDGCRLVMMVAAVSCFS